MTCHIQVKIEGSSVYQEINQKEAFKMSILHTYSVSISQTVCVSVYIAKLTDTNEHI